MLFLFTIMIVGIFTSYTDLKNKKIYNLHLLIGAVLGVFSLVYSGVFQHEQIHPHLINGISALIIGFLFFKFDIWRGGDAKLFTLFAFLMPLPVNNPSSLPNVISLFASSFLIGMIILIPVFINDIIINRNSILKELLTPEKLHPLFHRVVRMIIFSWILFPFYYLARITNPVIIFTIFYIVFIWNNHGSGKVHVITLLKKDLRVFLLFLIFGFLMRYMLSPSSLSFPVLTHYLLTVSISSSLSICIYTIINHFKDYRQRVPFAPLLFIGCMLSYTPFLTTMMRFMHR